MKPVFFALFKKKQRPESRLFYPTQNLKTFYAFKPKGYHDAAKSLIFPNKISYRTGYIQCSVGVKFLKEKTEFQGLMVVILPDISYLPKFVIISLEPLKTDLFGVPFKSFCLAS
jgi:hypothetical protein